MLSQNPYLDLPSGLMAGIGWGPCIKLIPGRPGAAMSTGDMHLLDPAGLGVAENRAGVLDTALEPFQL